MAKITRKFNGKIYKLAIPYPYKKTAFYHAKIWRKKGYLARVIKGKSKDGKKTLYFLYKRKK